MITVPQNNDGKPGAWKGQVTGRSRISAIFICPNGHELDLRKYEILSNGSVHPSVLCPIVGCGFNEFICLDGWMANRDVK